MKKPVLAVLILLAGGLLARGETLTSLGGGGYAKLRTGAYAKCVGGSIGY